MTVGRPGTADRPPAPVDPLDSRACGGCTVCCVHLRIELPELRKAAGVPCRHLVANGCGIYEDRPQLCRSYLCIWRYVSQLPDACRPDRCGVLFTQEANPQSDSPFSREYIRGLALRSSDDFNDPAARLAIQRLVDCEVSPVWLASGEVMHRIYPDEALADAILRPETTPHRHLLEKAAELRRKWNVTLPAA